MTAEHDRLRLLAKRIRGGAAPAPAAACADGTRLEPASFGQRRLWFLHQLQDRQAPYTLHAVKRATFALDPALLARTLDTIVARHEALRTTFRMTDQDLFQVVAAEGRIEPAVIDLCGHAPALREAEASRRMGEALAEPFDLGRGPLMRVWLFRLGPAEVLILVAVHHIIFDGPSFDLFFRELHAIYGALAGFGPLDLPGPRAQYSDFAREQRARLTPDRIARETAFWRDELARLPLLDLPTDRPRPPVPSFRGALCPVRVPEALVQRLQARATAARTTLFTVLLAGYWAMLARLCRQTDFGIGLPVTGRDTLARQEAIGFFVDTVVIRIGAGEDPTGDGLVEAAREAMKRSLAHKALPFDMVVEKLGPDRDLGVNPFFQTGFQFMEYFAAERSEEMTVPRSSAMFDLGMDLWFEGEAIAGRLEYNSDLFDRPTVAMMAAVFGASLEWLAEGDRPLSDLRLAGAVPPDGLSILRGPAHPVGAPCVAALIEAAVRRYPDATALEGAGTRLSYAALWDDMGRLCAALARRGLRPGDRMVLALERSPGLTRMILAALRMGVVFGCLDPAWPAERRRAVCAELAPALVVDADLFRALEGEGRADPPLPAPPLPGADDLAYVIFTSGSTGKPKGVEVAQLGLANVALAQRLAFALGPGRRVVQLSAPTFDASIFETVMALTAGATLAVAPPGILAGGDLADVLDGQRIDAVVAPPSIIATLPEGRGGALRLICVAGESCPADLAARFSGGAAMFNLYGPTEATIWATTGQRVEGARVVIGTPIPNTACFVTDAHLDVVPVGVVGELCLAGPGLARGYLNQPAQTGRSFPVLPGSGGRIYRTGDLVRQTRAGDLVFLGRADRQVKVRGLRVELEEIEVVLRATPGVEDAIVEATDSGAGTGTGTGTGSESGPQTALVAYLAAGPSSGEGLIDACRAALRGRLPAYMIPGRFVVVAGFARTASGKVDRKALPAPAEAPIHLHLPPATPTETAVAEVMAHVLRLGRIGAEDDFFHVGGHSLAAVALAARLSAVLGQKITVADVFAQSTVRTLARLIDARAAEGPAPDDEVPLVRLPRLRPEMQV